MPPTPDKTIVSWESMRAALQDHLNQMPQDADGVFQVTDSLRAAFKTLQEDIEDNNQRVFVLGQLDPAHAIPLCREGLCDWWPVFTGRAFFGDIDGLKKVHAAFTEDAGKGTKPHISSAMTWVSHKYKLKTGTSNDIRTEVLDQLMQWGADPNYEDGKWLGYALRTLETPNIAVFLDHGAHFNYIATELADARRQQNTQIIKNIEAALPGRSYDSLVDKDTLLQTRFLPDTYGPAAFKTLFNFKARRVTEIYEPTAQNKATQTSLSFADYDTEALKDAAQRLQKLGGQADALQTALDKPLQPVKAGLRRRKI